MPVRGSGKTVNKDAEKRKEEILRRIQASRPLVLDEDIEISDDENDEKAERWSSVTYLLHKNCIVSTSIFFVNLRLIAFYPIRF